MLVCSYCWNPAPEQPSFKSCCGEIHFVEVPDECPECGSKNLYESSHKATFSAPEATAWNCEDCGHQFNIE